MMPRDLARTELGPTPRVLAIIPAYNEATALPGVLRDLLEHLPCADIVIVNDGSTHAKSAVARGQGA